MPVYDPPNEGYTSAIPSGTAAFRTYLREQFGFERTEVVRDASRCRKQNSEHCVCRAVDAFTTDLKFGREVFEWCVEHAGPLGLQSVIFNRRVWGFGNWTERHYSGASPHTDHVHIGLSKLAARNLTRQRIIELTEEEPMTDEEFDKHMKRFISTVGIDFGWPIGAPDQEQTRTLAHVVKSLLRQNELMGQALGRIEKKLSP